MSEFSLPGYTSVADTISSQSLSNIGQPAPNLTEQKSSEVSQASQAKQLLLSGGGEYDGLATSILSNSGDGSSDLAQELANSGVGDLRLKYGDEVAAMASSLQNSLRRVQTDQDAQRDFNTITSDSLKGIGAGAVNALGGIASFGAGLINDEAGAFVAEKTDDAANFFRDSQSTNLQRKKELGNIRESSRQEDINAQYEQEVSDGDKYAGLRRFGREMLGTAKDLVENPALAGDLVSEGVGSLVGSAGITKIAASGAAKLVLRNKGMDSAAINAFMKTDEGKALIQEITIKGMPAGIGATEGGGAYVQIQTEIQGMTETELLQGSPEYTNLRDQGLSHEDARNEISNAAGLEGGAIQGLIGAATGKLVSKFEANPFTIGQKTLRGKVSEVGSNILKETVEEGIQEGSATVVSGDAVRRYADEDKDVFEGLGSSVVKGAAAGAGLAAGVQAPRVAAETAVEVVKGTAEAVSNAASKRLKSVEEGINEDSPVNTQEVKKSANELSSIVEELPETSQEDSVNVASILMASGSELNSSPEVVKDILFTDPETGLRDQVLDVDEPIAGRADVIAGVVNAIEDGSLDNSQKLEVSLWLRSQANQLAGLDNEDLSSQGEDLQKVAEQSRDIVNKILSNPVIKESIERAETAVSEDFGPLPTITDENINTEEVQKAIRIQTLLSQSNPSAVDPEFVSQLLSQRKLKFPEFVMKGLKLAGIIAREANASAEEKAVIAQETKQKLEETGKKQKAQTPSDIVRQQILEDGKDEARGQLGLTGHQSRIVSALQAGNVKEAQRSADALGNFAQSMLNRLEAARQSYALKRVSDNSVKYDVWDGDNWIKEGGSVYISPFSPTNVQVGREIAVDARSVVNTYNSIIEQFSDTLQGSPKKFDQPSDNEIQVIEEISEEENTKDVDDQLEEPSTKVEDVKETELGKEDLQSEKTEDDGEIVQVDERAKDDSNTEEESTAEPETQEVEPESGPVEEPFEESVQEEDTIASFPGLYKTPDGVNRFERAMTVDTSRSIVMQGEKPLNGVINILENFKDNEEALGLKTYADQDKANQFAKFIRDHGLPLAQAMNERLNAVGNFRAKGKKLTPLQAVDPEMNGGIDFSDFRQGKALAIIDTETGQYESRLLGGAVLAAMHWVLNEDSSKIPMDREDVAKVFGVDETMVTPVMMKSVNNWIRPGSAKESLGRTIMEFWGAQGNGDTTMSDETGIAQGVAAELLQLMEGKLITEHKVKVLSGKEANENTAIAIEIGNGSDQLKAQIRSLGALKSLMTEGFMPEVEKPVYLDQIPAQKANQKQKGNWIGELSGDYQEALKTHRETPHMRNEPFIGLIRDLGQEFYVEIMGGADFDPEVTHDLHAESLDGRLKGLRRSYELTLDHDQKVQDYAAANDKDPADVATHYDYFVAMNGRIMAKGFNGQSDKTMREAMSPTGSTLDLSDDVTHDRFWVAVGQMSGLVKPELLYRADSVKEAQDKVINDFEFTLEGLEAYLTEGVMTPEIQEQIMVDLKGKKLEPHALHALLDVARYNLAVKQEGGRSSSDAKEFKSFLALEADGKTDGPFHAMMHFLAKPFSVDQLKSLNKGGWFPNEMDMNLSKFFNVQDEGDLYESGAHLTKKFITEIRQELGAQDNKDALKLHNSMMRVLVQFGDLEMSTSGNGSPELVIGRKVLKNPLTITLYGSSEAGIAKKIASGMIDVMNTHISDLLEKRRETGDQTLWFSDTLDFARDVDRENLNSDLDALFTSRLMRKVDGSYYVTKNLPKDIQQFDAGGRALPTRNFMRPGMKSADLKKFEFSPANKIMIVDTIRSGMVRPMVEAIDQSTDYAREATKPMMAASNIQAAVVKDAFKRAIDEVIAERREAGDLSPREQMSRNDLKKVYAKVSPFAAVVESTSGTTQDMMHVNLSAAERGDLGFEFARSMTETYQGESAIPGPSSAGVSAMPLVTISEGDAQMMVKYFSKPGASRSLEQVFDGLNMPIDKLDEISADINEADAEAIFRNPLMNASDSFADFLRQGEDGPFSVISDPEVYKEILRAVDQILNPGENSYENITKGLKKDSHYKAIPALREVAEQGVTSINQMLKDNAQAAEARKRVIKGMGFSLDHMAGAESPYSHEGKLYDVTSESDLVDQMNADYDEALAEIRKADKDQKEAPATAGANKDLEEALKSFGKTEDDVTVMSLNALSKIMGGITLRDNEEEILAAMMGSIGNFKVVFGTSDVVTNWRNKAFPLHKSAGPVELGQADIENGFIYIANNSSETILHEMLHAVVGAKIVDYYTDPTLVDETSRAAIQNLESIMGQFMEMNFVNEDANTTLVANELKMEISSYLGSGSAHGKSTALNEFIAWTLTNQKLEGVLKKTKSRSKLKNLIDRALVGLKRLLGIPQGRSLDVFTNIKWNTGALIKLSRLDPETEIKRGGSFSHLLNQRNTDPRLKNLTADFELKVASQIRKVDPLDRAIEEFDVSEVTQQSLNNLTANGLRLTQEQSSAYRSIFAAMSTSMQMDSASLTRMNKLFKHVLTGLKVEDLMGSEVSEFNPNDRAQAETLFNILTGKVGVTQDRQGRSSMLASFLALSQVSPEFRAMLDKKDLPKRPEIVTNSVDETLNTAANKMMDYLSSSIVDMIGDRGKELSTGSALDRLAGQLARIERDNRTIVEIQANKIITGGDTLGSNLLQSAGDKMGQFADAELVTERGTLAGETENLIRKSVGILGSLTNKDRVQSMAKALTSIGNQQSTVPDTIIKLMNEVFGITDENRAVYSMVNRVKSAVSGLRQDHREVLPKVLSEKFSRELSQREWESMHLGLGQTDIAVLGGTKSIKDITDFLNDPAKLKAAIVSAQDLVVSSLAPKVRKNTLRKAEELAKYMVTGEIDAGNHNLLKNASAISLMLGEPENRLITADQAEKSKPLLDEYISLLALQKVGETNPDALSDVKNLLADERDGTEFVIYYMAQMRQLELDKATTPEAVFNGYKGYIPAETLNGVDMKIVDDSEYARLISLGYTRIGDYQGSGFEKGSKGYYFSTVGGNATFNQGVMQTVQKTANGVDLMTGRSVAKTTAGMLPKGSVASVQARIKSGTVPKRGEALMPIYNAQGQVSGYERSISAEMSSKLRKNTHLGEMVGAWSGRQAEEQLAEKYNRELIDRLKEVHERDLKNDRGDEFVNLADPALENQLWQDAWNVIPPETKRYISEVFGEDTFMIRKDMIDNTVGYRSLSVGEAWTGPSDLPSGVRKVINDVTTLIMGKNTYRNIVTAEKAWQAGISVAKQTIVIRSVIVPASNIASNVIQLLMNNVGLRDIAKGFKVKLVEIDQHLKNQARKVEIDAELSQYGKNNIKRRKLETEKKALDDASKRMSIWPLIEAGEFSTISEGLTDADAALAQGRWADWMQGLMDKIPAQLGTAGRYAMITRDTALFQGMSRAVQYGDFLAKAVLYEHKTKNEGQTDEQAMELVAEEFVNYNLLPGQVRSYSESMGLAWFWAFKIRSIKVAHRHLRDHPLRALLAGVAMPYLPDVPGVNVGSPITDNAVSVIAEGRAGYALGPGMLWQAPSLNPWVNIAN